MNADQKIGLAKDIYVQLVAKLGKADSNYERIARRALAMADAFGAVAELSNELGIEQKPAPAPLATDKIDETIKKVYAETESKEPPDILK